MAKLLFICSKNQWRSPTAEMLFKHHPVHQARSAGTSERARIKVNEKLINWADVIFVMERKHKEQLWNRYSFALDGKALVVLNIEDNYGFADAQLVEILKQLLAEYL